MWSDDENIHNTIITRQEEYLFVLIKTKDGSWVRSNSNCGNNSTLMSRCIKLLKTQCIDNDWLKQNQNSSLGKLLFKN